MSPLPVPCGSYLRVCDAYSIVKSHHSVRLGIGLGKQALSCTFDCRVRHEHPETNQRRSVNYETCPEVSTLSFTEGQTLTFGSRKDLEAEYGWRYRWMWTCHTSTQDLYDTGFVSSGNCWQKFRRNWQHIVHVAYVSGAY